ncbi:MAG: hypothetical protein V1716_05035 [Candidatus Uhrbacteria bacterium]
MRMRSENNLKKLITFLVIILTVVSLCPQIVLAVAPNNIVTYQGRLLDSNGVPVSSATASISFSFYTAVSGGSCLWSNSSETCATATARSVTLTDGLFTENLGDTSAGILYAAILDSVFADNASVYLEVVVGGETLTPRKQITATPYAINSHKLDGLDSSNFLRDNGDTGTGAFDFTSATFSGTSPFVFEGSADDAFETSFTVTNPTADNVVTFKNASGTVAYLTDILLAVNNLSDLTNTATARQNLDLEIGVDIQAYDAGLVDVAGLSVADGNFIVGNGTNWVAESGSTVRTSLGLGSLATLNSIDISDNTNLLAGTNITLDGDTLNVDDAFLLNNGDTGTGAFDFTSATFSGTSPFVFEGSADDAFETSFTVTNPTADNVVTFKNASGTVAYLTDIPAGASLWEVGTNGSYEDDDGVIIGADAAFSHGGGASGDLKVTDEFEVIGAAYFDGDSTFSFAGTENMALSVNPANGNTVTGLHLELTGLDSGDTGSQFGLVVNNAASSEAFDILTYISNSDTDDQVGYGIFLSGGSGGIGNGIYMSQVDDGVYVGNTANSSAFTGKQMELVFDQNYTSGASINNTGQGLVISRNITMNNAGQTLTVSGDMLSLSSDGTQTLGTLTDTSNMISLVQNYGGATGNIIDMDNNSTGKGIYIFQRGGASALGIRSTGAGASAVIDVTHKVNYGEIIEVDYDSATSLIENLSGLSMDLNTSVTANDNYDINGFYINLPTLTSNSGGDSAQLNGVSIAGGNLTTSAADTLSWNGLLSVSPNITQTAGTLVASGAYLQTGTITTGGTQNGIYVMATGVGAGTLNGVSVSSITASTGSETGLKIGDGWDDAININNGAFIVETTGAVDLETSLTIDAPAYVASGYTQRLCTSTGGGNGLTLDNVTIVDCLDAGQADYAEMYPIASGVTYGDIVVPGSIEITTERGETIVQMIKSTTAYQNIFGGVVVDNYEDGTSAGYNIADIDNPMPVSLVGRIPVHVTNEGGIISVGDAITTSSTAGYGMKATEPGMIIGYALNNFSGTSGEVMVFVHSGWYAGNVISTDGSATVVSDTLIMNSLSNASSGTPAVASQAFALRGSAWNGSSAQALDMKIQTSITDTDNYRLSIKNTSDTEVAYITNEGTMSLTGDLVVTGRIYPSDRGTTQTSKYIYYDGSAGPGGDMMRTNASGWSTGSYDFAEMFPSDEKLEAGDVVVFTGSNEKIGRSSSTYNQQIAGIISTRPGFLAGENDPNHFPVALAGRVPTKVNLEGGPIAVGDALTTSSTAGYAMKAAEAGMVVGYALEPYTGSGNNKITVFVNINYFDGGETSTVPGISNTASLLSSNLSSLNLEGGLYMGGNDILNIRRLAGISNRWTIEEDGTIKTEATLKTIITSYQNEKIETTAVTSSGGTFITLVGSAKLQNGEATISFEAIDPNFNDITSTTEPIRVIITPNGPVSLYVSEKNNNGFMVKQIGGSDSGTKFDWMVSATRKGFEPVVEATEASEASEATNLDSAQDPIESDDVTEEYTVPIPSEDDVSDEPTQESTQEILVEEPTETESSFSDTESPLPGLEAISPDSEAADESAPSESPTQTSDPVIAGEGGLNTEPPATDSASSDSSTQTGT